LSAALDNVTHRSAGTGGVDTLTDPADRAFVARFLESIDAATTPIPEPQPHRAVQVQITGEARPPARAQRSRFGAVRDLHAPHGASGDPQDDRGEE
jgi:hypothetical protein